MMSAEKLPEDIAMRYLAASSIIKNITTDFKKSVAAVETPH